LTNGVADNFLLQFWLRFKFNPSFFLFWGVVIRIARVCVVLGWSYGLINNPLEWLSMCYSIITKKRDAWEVLAIRVRCSRQTSKGFNLLSKMCECFSLHSSKVLIKVLPHPPVNVHTICLDQWNHNKLCVGFFYYEISYIFFFILHDDTAFLFSLKPIPTIDIRVY